MGSPALVQLVDTQDFGPSTCAGTFTLAQNAGDTIALYAAAGNGESVTGILDTSGNLYRPVFAYPSPVQGVRVEVWKALNIAAAAPGANTFTVQFSGGDNTQVFALELEPCDAGVTAANSAPPGDVAMTTGPFESMLPESLIVAYLIANLPVPGAGFTLLGTNAFFQFGIESAPAITPGTFTATATAGDIGNPWDIVAVAWAPPPGTTLLAMGFPFR